MLVDDLFFAAKIETAARHLGVDVVRDAPDTAGDAADLVIVDLHGRRDPIERIRALRTEAPGVPIVAFFSHVEVELRRRALEAGADQVLPRSAFTARLAAILGGAPPDTRT
jgi:DNA-binding NarL/FixJ family response regulator